MSCSTSAKTSSRDSSRPAESRLPGARAGCAGNPGAGCLPLDLIGVVAQEQRNWQPPADAQQRRDEVARARIGVLQVLENQAHDAAIAVSEFAPFEASRSITEAGSPAREHPPGRARRGASFGASPTVSKRSREVGHEARHVGRLGAHELAAAWSSGRPDSTLRSASRQSRVRRGRTAAHSPPATHDHLGHAGQPCLQLVEKTRRPAAQRPLSNAGGLASRGALQGLGEHGQLVLPPDQHHCGRIKGSRGDTEAVSVGCCIRTTSSTGSTATNGCISPSRCGPPPIPRSSAMRCARRTARTNRRG